MVIFRTYRTQLMQGTSILGGGLGDVMTDLRFFPMRGGQFKNLKIRSRVTRNQIESLIYILGLHWL